MFVGSSAAVSGQLAGAPVAWTQGLRYALGCLLLSAVARRRRRGGYPALRRPAGWDWFWLGAVTVTGLVLFNVGLVEGSRHAEPAVFGVAVACVPVLFAALAPVLERRRPRLPVLAAALVVTGGAALVQGFGRCDGLGLLWAVVVFGCEAGFTLFAVPLLRRHGPLWVSVYSTGLAAVALCLWGASFEGWDALTRVGPRQWLAMAYLALAVTAVAFLLWYTAVTRLGADRAGLITGLAPVSAALAGVALGGPVPHLAVFLGMAVVMVGLAYGITRAAPQPERSTAGPGRTRAADAGGSGRLVGARSTGHGPLP
jgi:drug/metabolite transporter (DMT)-like permease